MQLTNQNCKFPPLFRDFYKIMVAHATGASSLKRCRVESAHPKVADGSAHKGVNTSRNGETERKGSD